MNIQNSKRNISKLLKYNNNQSTLANSSVFSNKQTFELTTKSSAEQDLLMINNQLGNNQINNDFQYNQISAWKNNARMVGYRCLSIKKHIQNEDSMYYYNLNKNLQQNEVKKQLKDKLKEYQASHTVNLANKKYISRQPFDQRWGNIDQIQVYNIANNIKFANVSGFQRRKLVLRPFYSKINGKISNKSQQKKIFSRSILNKTNKQNNIQPSSSLTNSPINQKQLKFPILNDQLILQKKLRLSLRRKSISS